MKEILYLVYYTRGAWDNYAEVVIFATSNIDKARQYVEKFNTKLSNWKIYFKNFDYHNIQDKHWERFDMINELNEAKILVIEKR